MSHASITAPAEKTSFVSSKLAQLSGPLPNAFKYLYNTNTERGLKA